MRAALPTKTHFGPSCASARVLFCGVAGAMLGLAAPPFDLYPALWLGMAALAWACFGDSSRPPFATRAPVALTGARRGLAFGIGANLVALRFIPGVVARFTPLPWAAGFVALVLLAVFEAARWLVAGVACATLSRARVPRPIAFAAGVYAGTFLPTMLPWTPAGGVTLWPEVVQFADVIGERGVAALMALTAGLAANGGRAALRPRTRVRGAVAIATAAAIVVAQVTLGSLRMRTVDRARISSPHARVALVQPSIPASTRWQEERAPAVLQRLTELTQRAEALGAELVVWPEAAYPYRVVHGTRRDLEGERAIVQPLVHGPLLVGLLTGGARSGAAYNSAVVATKDGAISESYDKRHLLWFGEIVPLADRVPWLGHVFARGLGLAPGDRSVVLTAGRVRAGVLSCYEDTLPEAGREAMEGHPNVLANLTNDAWFFPSSESELHLRLAVLRAVEQRRDLVRAVNQGQTSWIDAAGRVRARASAEVPGVLLAEPVLADSPPTLFARCGDTPWALAALALANVAVWRAARRGGNAPGAPRRSSRQGAPVRTSKRLDVTG